MGLRQRTEGTEARREAEGKPGRVQGSDPGGPAPTREREGHRETGPWLLTALKPKGGGRGRQEVGAVGKLGREKKWR